MGNHEDESHEFADLIPKRVHAIADELAWSDILLPLQRGRLADACAEHGIGEPDAKGNALHALIDLNQDPTKRKKICFNPKKVGTTMFTFTHHGFVWDTENDKPLLTLDWALGHGLIAYPEALPLEKGQVSLRRLLRNKIIAYSKMREMIGMGWHAISMGS